MTIKKILLLTSIFFLSCSREYIKPLNVKRNFSGSLWVVRHEIATPEKIDILLKSIKNTEIRNLFVQVRGRGDSYYISGYEPRAYDVPENFDPLQYLIIKCKDKDIKIHAWVNVSFVLDPENYPPHPEHILFKHPEWITYDYKGRSMAEYTSGEMKKNLLEGYFLDPSIPGVKKYICSIIADILSRYDVDGIHLDYIRYPYSGYNRYYKKHLSDFGYNPQARKIFKNKYGIDPLKINRFKNSRIKRKFDQFRRDQITETVRMINKEIKLKDSSLILSAAVMPRPDIGRDVYFQDWPLWLEKDYIDIACVMSYTASNSTYQKYINQSLLTENPGKIFMGIRVKDKTTVKKAYEQISMSYHEGFRGYIIFSFRHDKKYLEKVNNLINYEDEVYTN